MTKKYSGHLVGVKNLNEIEEAICIEVAILLRPDTFKRFAIVPLLSVLSLGVFAVKLFWSVELQSRWLYQRVSTVHGASNILI
jgi:hypothetical protein